MPSQRPFARPQLPAAVSTLSGVVLHGPVSSATVAGVHRYGVYLSVPDGVLPVLTSDAVALPTAVRLGVTSSAVASLARAGEPWGAAVGDVVTVGAGRVVLPALDVVAVRTWRPARVRSSDAGLGSPGGRPGDHLSTSLDEVLGELSGGVDDRGWLANGIRTAVSCLGCRNGCPGGHPSTRPGQVGEAVAALVGRGPGLTPSGDDALAGALLVAHALGTGAALADAVRSRLGATTAVSAALLGAAAGGYAARPVVTLVDAAVGGDADAVSRALPAVLALGHSSGADTVTGIRAALLVLGSGVGCPAGRQEGDLSSQLGPTRGRSAA